MDNSIVAKNNFPMAAKCMVALSGHGPKATEGTLIGFAPAVGTYQVEVCGSKNPLSVYTVDALVLLHTFSHGSIYQLPMTRIKIVDEWWGAEDE